MAKGKKTGGRVKGTPNAVTANAREAISRFIDGNAHRLQEWLDAIAADEKQGPKAAMECFKDLLEYHVPKLARTELTGPDGGPMSVAILRFDGKDATNTGAAPRAATTRSSK